MRQKWLTRIRGSTDALGWGWILLDSWFRSKSVQYPLPSICRTRSFWDSHTPTDVGFRKSPDTLWASVRREIDCSYGLGITELMRSCATLREKALESHP